MTNKEAIKILTIQERRTRMKLMIDIDEDYVKIINKNGANNYPEEVIKNGTPLPTGEWIEVKHRLNLLIGVLYSNQLISKSDLDYMDDSIKKLTEGEEE